MTRKGIVDVKNNLLFAILAFLLPVIIIVTCISVGEQSYGLVEDEVFCYISSNNRGG